MIKRVGLERFEVKINQTTMKRLFKEFWKTYPRLKKINDPAKITILFNRWVGKTKDSKGFKRFKFKAHTTKHTVRVWMFG